MVKLLAGMILMSLTLSCANIQGSREKGDLLAARKLGEYSTVPSVDQQFVLYVKDEKPRQGIQPLTFVVYSVQVDSVVYERSLESGTVRWRDATKLEITRIPGNITGDETPDQFTEIYDLNAGRTR